MSVLPPIYIFIKLNCLNLQANCTEFSYSLTFLHLSWGCSRGFTHYIVWFISGERPVWMLFKSLNISQDHCKTRELMLYVNTIAQEGLSNEEVMKSFVPD